MKNLNAPVLTGCGIVNMNGGRQRTELCISRPPRRRKPSIYDPLAEYQKIVLDAINIGRMGMSKSRMLKFRRLSSNLR